MSRPGDSSRASSVGGKRMASSSHPEPEKWYPLVLGDSMRRDAKTKNFTLRYEFKPASIDEHRPGKMFRHGPEGKARVEYPNQSADRAPVAFEGHAEACKEFDCLLLFDGQSLRLERLHYAVRNLRHVRHSKDARLGGGGRPVGGVGKTLGEGSGASAAQAAAGGGARAGEVEEIGIGEDPEGKLSPVLQQQQHLPGTKAPAGEKAAASHMGSKEVNRWGADMDVGKADVEAERHGGVTQRQGRWGGDVEKVFGSDDSDSEGERGQKGGEPTPVKRKEEGRRLQEGTPLSKTGTLTKAAVRDAPHFRSSSSPAGRKPQGGTAAGDGASRLSAAAAGGGGGRGGGGSSLGRSPQQQGAAPGFIRDREGSRMTDRGAKAMPSIEIRVVSEKERKEAKGWVEDREDAAESREERHRQEEKQDWEDASTSMEDEEEDEGEEGHAAVNEGELEKTQDEVAAGEGGGHHGGDESGGSYSSSEASGRPGEGMSPAEGQEIMREGGGGDGGERSDDSGERSSSAHDAEEEEDEHIDIQDDGPHKAEAEQVEEEVEEEEEEEVEEEEVEVEEEVEEEVEVEEEEVEYEEIEVEEVEGDEHQGNEAAAGSTSPANVQPVAHVSLSIQSRSDEESDDGASGSVSHSSEEEEEDDQHASESSDEDV